MSRFLRATPPPRVAASDYSLPLASGNGGQRILGVEPHPSEGIFAELREPGRFNAVRVSFDTVEWPNGADLCPEVLYEESVPVAEPLAVKA